MYPKGIHLCNRISTEALWKILEVFRNYCVHAFGACSFPCGKASPMGGVGRVFFFREKQVNPWNWFSISLHKCALNAIYNRRKQYLNLNSQTSYDTVF